MRPMISRRVINVTSRPSKMAGPGWKIVTHVMECGHSRDELRGPKQKVSKRLTCRACEAEARQNKQHTVSA